MDKKKNSRKIPGAVIALVFIIIAAIVFVPTVYMPYNENKPALDSEHDSAEAQIALYDSAVDNQANIEANIKALQAEWDEVEKEMYVDASQTLDDLYTACVEIGSVAEEDTDAEEDDESEDTDTDTTVSSRLTLMKFNRSDAQQDSSESYSQTGNPLYYVTVSLEMYATRDALLEFLDYVEQESVGCYYISKMDLRTMEDFEDHSTYVVNEGDFNVSMTIYLYYYNTDITVDLEALEAAEAASDTEDE